MLILLWQVTHIHYDLQNFLLSIGKNIFTTITSTNLQTENTALHTQAKQMIASNLTTFMCPKRSIIK